SIEKGGNSRSELTPYGEVSRDRVLSAAAARFPSLYRGRPARAGAARPAVAGGRPRRRAPPGPEAGPLPGPGQAPYLRLPDRRLLPRRYLRPQAAPGPRPRQDGPR